MDKLGAMKAFVEIVDKGSLTAAAGALGKAQPTMVRTLANLEASLGTRLLRRTTRKISLTEEGRDYLARCRQILADVDEAERALVSGETDPRGQLRLTAPVTFGQWHLAPLVVEFLEQHPRVQVELLLLDRVVNLLEEGIDLAVRIGALADSSMIAVQVGRMRRVVVASPELLARTGIPADPHALADHPCIRFQGLGTGASWQFQSRGSEVRVPIQGPFATNQVVAAVEACAAGMGFGCFLAYQVAPWLSSGALRIVLEDYEREPAPVSLVYTEARLMTPRLRALLSFTRERLTTALD